MRTDRRWWLRALGAATTVGVFLVAAPSPAAAAFDGQYWLTRLSLTKAWTVSKGKGAVVAVVDAGVNDTLGDLRGQVLPGKDFSGGGDGRNDPGEDCQETKGCYSHGTDMALDIAGTAQGNGFQGVAPQAKILPVKISAKSGDDFTADDVARGLRWAVDHGADVVSISLSTSAECPPAEAAAAKYAYQHDVIVVASTGNTGGAVTAPANCPGVLAVGGIDQDFKPWSLSNSGPATAFVGAAVDVPEEGVTGTSLTGGDGTSSATAIVAATFALIRAHSPDMSARDAVTHAINNVHNGTGTFGARINDKLGYGEILPYFAMTYPIKNTAPNPIYDTWARRLGPPQPGVGTSSTSRPPVSSTPPVTQPASSQPATQPSVHPITAGGGSDAAGDSGGNTGLIIGIVIAVVVVGGGAGLLFARGRRGSAGP